MGLSARTCTPCKGGIDPLAEAEATPLLREIPDWDLTHESKRLERTFRFRNFAEALGFVDKVGRLAESEAHHPEIRFGWGYVTIELWTHKIGGLHENDFILASKIDDLARV